MGRATTAEPFHCDVPAPHDGARWAGMGGGAYDRGGGFPHANERSEDDDRILHQPRFRLGGFQRTKAHAARLESSTAPADPAQRWTNDRVDVAARGFLAPGLRA